MALCAFFLSISSREPLNRMSYSQGAGVRVLSCFALKKGREKAKQDTHLVNHLAGRAHLCVEVCHQACGGRTGRLR